MSADRHVNEDMGSPYGYFCVYSCICVWLCAYAWWVDINRTITHTLHNPQSHEILFYEHIGAVEGVGGGVGGAWGVLWPQVFEMKSVYSSCLLWGWRQQWVGQNMHGVFHNLSCPLAARRGHAYLLRVGCPQDTWYPICYCQGGLDNGSQFLNGCSINHIVWQRYMLTFL